MSIAIGSKINNRYRIVSRLAQGGMAEVYEAQDLEEKHNCAVKFILEELVSNKDSIYRFNREAQIGKKIKHPGIVQVYDSGVFENRPYIVSEYISGQTLGEKIKLSSNITYIEACEIMVQLCDVLTYLYIHSIIHRDIKPDNIYYLYDGSVKLGDFGIAIDLTNIHAEDYKSSGSAHYMSPELCQKRAASKLTDMYALGVTFYEIVTGELPFKINDPYEVMKYHINYEIPQPSLKARSLPKPIEKIIMKACKNNPSERYQSFKEMKNDLLLVLDNKRKFTKQRSLFQKIFGFIGE